MESVDFAGEGPEFWSGNESFADWVRADVGEFLAVFFRSAEAMMERSALPNPFAVCVLAGELRFPIGHPPVDGEPQIAWGAKEVDVIGHEEVIADKPGIS